jgi:hypothetical protein
MVVIGGVWSVFGGRWRGLKKWGEECGRGSRGSVKWVLAG